MAERQRFDRLTISGFRGLEDLELSGLGEVNILLGANDVGKTSILEAVFLIANPAEPRGPIRVQNAREFPVQKIDDFASVFFDLNLDRTVVIEVVSGGDERRRIVVSASDIESPISVDEKSNGKFQASKKQELEFNVEVQSNHGDKRSFRTKLTDNGDKWAIDRKSLDDVVIEEITVPTSLFLPSSEYKAKRIGELIVDKRDQLLIDYLQHINSRVTKVAVLGEIAYLDIGLAKMMPLNMFGSGMIRTAMILAECILKDAKILLIDEIEQGLHYQAISFLLEAILKLSKEQDVQIFATTHSIEVIETLQQVLGKRDFAEHRETTKCITLQRDKDRLVRAYRYDYQQFDHCIEHGIEIR